MSGNLRVSLLGENEIVREGLRRILSERGFLVQRTYVRAAELLAYRDEYDLLIIDAFDFDQGLAECRRLRQALSARIVLMVDECDAANIAEACRSTVVDGFFSKAVSCEALAGILRLVALGERYLPFQALEIASLPARSESQYRKELSAQPYLSDREAQVLGCLTNGDSNKLISRRLHIADATVKVHVKAILRKLRVSNRTQAAIWGERSSITHLPEQSPLAARATPILPDSNIHPALGCS